eukprot:1320269-Pleurochrysis_carterae.AAC.2
MSSPFLDSEAKSAKKGMERADVETRKSFCKSWKFGLIGWVLSTLLSRRIRVDKSKGRGKEIAAIFGPNFLRSNGRITDKAEASHPKILSDRGRMREKARVTYPKLLRGERDRDIVDHS